MATTTTSTLWPPKLRLLQSQLSSEERQRIPSQLLMKILGQHSNRLLPMQMGKGNEYWLNSYVDFDKVFLMGDSAGANLAHYMGMRHGLEKLEGVKIEGMTLFYPYFRGKKPIYSW